MPKEVLTIDAIKSDLIKIAEQNIIRDSDRRFVFIIPCFLISVILGVIVKSIFISLPFLLVAIYHAARFITEYRAYRSKRSAVLSTIRRGDVSISIETLSHIADEVMYEPHRIADHTKASKTITVYYFEGSSSWRVPWVIKHYDWSKEYYISSKGLENISVKGDEFYFVSLTEHPDISYIYPRKTFMLDKNLEKQDSKP